MTAVLKLSRRARWAVPAGALAVTGGVLAGSLVPAAAAAPALPSRTPAQLLAAAVQVKPPALSGTVTETASLGLPSLPGGASPTSIASLLTGSHTVQVWYAGPEHYRLALPSPMGETDLIRDGGTAYLWNSGLNTVTEAPVPVPGRRVTGWTGYPPLTPQQAARQVLAAAGPTTTVRADSNVTVAGQAAYQLVLAPRDSRSLIGQVVIALDGANAAPLQVQVFARGASSPAVSVGYTSVRFGAPAPADTSFTPPPSAKVVKVSPGRPGTIAARAIPARAIPARAVPAGVTAAGVTTAGSGWLTVLEFPSSLLTAASGGSGSAAPGGPASGSGGAGDGAAVMGALLASAARVHGAWGSGRLLRTSLISVLITGSGRAYAGAVQPSVLYGAASR